MEKDIYCAQCGEPQRFEVVQDGNQEYVATCPKGHFLKFPAETDLDEQIDIHNIANDPA
jgi:uncharacterized Zn finger protein